MYKTITIKGDVLTSKVNKNNYIDNLNDFYRKNPNIKIIDIKHIITNFDDYTALITYEE